MLNFRNRKSTALPVIDYLVLKGVDPQPLCPLDTSYNFK